MINISDSTRTLLLKPFDISKTKEDELVENLNKLNLKNSTDKLVLFTIYKILFNVHDDNYQLKSIDFSNVLYYTIESIRRSISEENYNKSFKVLSYSNTIFNGETVYLAGRLLNLKLNHFWAGSSYTYQGKKCYVNKPYLEVESYSLESIIVQFKLHEFTSISFCGIKFLPSIVEKLCTKESLYEAERDLKNKLNPENESLNDLEYHHKLGYVTSQEYSDAVKEIKKNRVLKEIKDKESERAKVIYEEYMNAINQPRKVHKKTLCQRIKSYFKKQEEYNEFI